MSDWCILRCAASRTLSLASALVEAGYQAWTPVETVVARCNKTRSKDERKQPITPTFVFADYDQLSDLRRLVASPSQCFQVWDPEQRRMVTRGIPYFSLFRFDSRYPAIADRALEPLRRFERQRLPRIEPTVFEAGQKVELNGSGFDGLTGVIEGVRGRSVLVSLPGWPIAVEVNPRRVIAA